MALADIKQAAKSTARPVKVKDLDFENDKVRLWTRKREDGNWEYDWLPMGTELRESFSYWLYSREITSEYVFFLCR